MKIDDRLKNVELLLSDVDGVLSDGGIIFDNQGIETKRFNVRDGLGIKLWQRAGYKFGIVTARNSQIVKMRSAELSVDIVRQGRSDKLPVVQEIINDLELQPAQVAYIGDDLPDLPVISSVGLGVAVADAVDEVCAAAALVVKRNGGDGAVREVIEMILKAKKSWDDLIRKYQ